jgi:hypothetical protein
VTSSITEWREARQRRPRGVVIEHASGAVTRVNVRYDGLRDGTHVWVPTTPGLALGPGDRLTAVVVPPRSVVMFTTEAPSDSVEPRGRPLVRPAGHDAPGAAGADVEPGRAG